MARWRFWEKKNDSAVAAVEVGGTRQRTATVGGPPPLPPRETATPVSTSDAAAMLARLQRKREGVMFDFEQAELARQEENPWQERIALLTEALAIVETDRLRLEDEPKRAGAPLPATPIEEIEVSTDGPATVAFQIGDEVYRYEEEVDWAERGTTVVQGELHQIAGSPTAIVPDSLPEERRAELADHLTDSLFVFAVDLRDRALAGEPAPVSPTLADLAMPCPECGGWRDWAGHCPACAWMALRRQELAGEAARLEAERTSEADERRRVIEGLPIARRRLADIDADIAALGG